MPSDVLPPTNTVVATTGTLMQRAVTPVSSEHWRKRPASAQDCRKAQITTQLGALGAHEEGRSCDLQVAIARPASRRRQEPAVAENGVAGRGSGRIRAPAACAVPCGRVYPVPSRVMLPHLRLRLRLGCLERYHQFYIPPQKAISETATGERVSIK